MIRLDYTAESVVAVCSSCGWRTLTFDRSSAWRSARRHEQRAHPESRQATKAACHSFG